MGLIAFGPAGTRTGYGAQSIHCVSALERFYPRICAALVSRWRRPDIDAYLNGLILDDRSDRQGFPMEVMDELLFLSDLRCFLDQDGRPYQPALPETYDLVPAPRLRGGLCAGG